MTILKSNIDKALVTIPIYNVYIKITDYGARFLLRSVKISPGQHTWVWVSLKEGAEIDISGIGDRYCSFDNAVNQSVNDPYETVYMFGTLDECIKNWSVIVYENSITTKYQGCEDKS